MLSVGKTKGSITLEAAIIMPFYLAFVLALITIIKISIVDIALYSAVSESTKQLAAHMYPVDLLYQEYKTSDTAEKIDKLTGKIMASRDNLNQSEHFIDHYSALIPKPLSEIANWELTQRNNIETSISNQFNNALIRVFKPILTVFVDKNLDQRKKLNDKQLILVTVILPNLTNKAEAYFGLEAQYKLSLPIPFFRKTIYIRKRSIERVWVGL